jgi:hypothetical protein
MKKVLAISSVLLGVVFLAGCGQQPVSQTQPTTLAPLGQQSTANKPITTQPTPTAPVKEAIYTNTQYGFQFTLPEGWDNYKPIINEVTGNKNVVAYVYIYLPTDDNTWIGDIDPRTGASLKGYARACSIAVWSVDGHKIETKRCETEPNPSCPATVMYVENSRYVLELKPSLELPGDLQKMGVASACKYATLDTQ